VPNAQATTLIVCLVSRQYLESEACATEFRVAWNLGKLMVVCLDPPDIGSFKRAMLATDTKATPTASGPFMYVAGGGQLTAGDQLAMVADEIDKVLVSRRAQAAATEDERGAPPTPSLGKTVGATRPNEDDSDIHKPDKITRRPSRSSGGRLAAVAKEKEEVEVRSTLRTGKRWLQRAASGPVRPAQRRRREQRPASLPPLGRPKFYEVDEMDERECNDADGEEGGDDEEADTPPKLTEVLDESFDDLMAWKETQVTTEPSPLSAPSSTFHDDEREILELELELEHDFEPAVTVDAPAAPAPASVPPPPTDDCVDVRVVEMDGADAGGGGGGDRRSYADSQESLAKRSELTALLKLKEMTAKQASRSKLLMREITQAGVSMDAIMGVTPGGSYGSGGGGGSGGARPAHLARQTSAPASAPAPRRGGSTYWDGLFGTACTHKALDGTRDFSGLDLVNRQISAIEYMNERSRRWFIVHNDDDQLFQWAKTRPGVASTGDVFRGKRITDVGAVVLAALCQNLTSIDLSETQITDAGVEMLAASCSELTDINVSNCFRLTDKAVESLGAYAPKLTRVCLDGTRVTDDSAKALAKTCPLKWAGLANTGLSAATKRHMVTSRPDLTIYAPF